MARLLTLRSGYRRVDYANVGSTNALALERAREGDPGRLWITADSQWQGRGRRGRSWQSPRGNLYASLLLIGSGQPDDAAATLAFAAGLALHRALQEVAGEPVAQRLRLKWPNDVLVDGRKLAGILLEGEALAGGSLATVIGFGANCISHPPTGNGYPATDLAAEGVDVAAELLFNSLARCMVEALGQWDGGRDFAAVRDAWLARAQGIGDPIRVLLGDRVVEGRFEDLDADGRLLVGQADGSTTAVSAGDVFFAPAG